MYNTSLIPKYKLTLKSHKNLEIKCHNNVDRHGDSERLKTLKNTLSIGDLVCIFFNQLIVALIFFNIWNE